MTHSTPFAARRAQLAAQLGAGGVAVIPTAPEQRRNRDSDYPYRYDSYFYYLTGFAEPGAWLVLDATGRSTLFCRPKDAEREVWTGVRLGPQAAPAAHALQTAPPVKQARRNGLKRRPKLHGPMGFRSITGHSARQPDSRLSTFTRKPGIRDSRRR